MKLIIAGSRSITDYETIKLALNIVESLNSFDTIISGGAKGVDSLGEKYAKEKGLNLKRMTANWDYYGKRAGYIRNESMAKEGDALLAIWDGKSKGTKHMIDVARNNGLMVYLYEMFDIFVYGTLMNGYGNHHFLKNSQYIGKGHTLESSGYEMWVDYLPYVMKTSDPSSCVFGEIYKVDSKTLNKLDSLEGHPSFYERKQVDIVTDNGICKCWMYESKIDKDGLKLVETGDYRDYEVI